MGCRCAIDDERQLHQGLTARGCDTQHGKGRRHGERALTFLASTCPVRLDLGCTVYEFRPPPVALIWCSCPDVSRADVTSAGAGMFCRIPNWLMKLACSWSVPYSFRPIVFCQLPTLHNITSRHVIFLSTKTHAQNKVAHFCYPKK